MIKLGRNAGIRDATVILVKYVIGAGFIMGFLKYVAMDVKVTRTITQIVMELITQPIFGDTSV